MSVSPLLTVSALLVAAGALTGCPAKPKPVIDPVGEVLPSPSALLARISTAAQSRRSLRALGRVTYFGEEGRVRLNVVEVVERPARFRIETISPLEQPIDTMTSDGERLWLLSKGVLREGPATPENIARLVPIPLRASELVDVLLGGVPISDRYKAVRVERSAKDAELLELTLEDDAHVQALITIDPAESKVLSAEVKEASGELRFSVVFSDFQALSAGGALPKTIEFKMPARKLDVSIKLKELEANVAIEPTLFVLVPPPGVRPEPLPSPPVPVDASGSGR